VLDIPNYFKMRHFLRHFPFKEESSPGAGMPREAMDQELMLRVRKGERRAFEELFARFKGPIMSYIYRFISDRDRAEDICQEVFLRVWRARESYEPRAKVSTWLWTLAHNVAIDELRKKTEQPLQQNQDEEGSRIPDLLERIESPLASAEEQLIENARESNVQACIGKLSEQQRDALLMKIHAELSYDEIAETLKTNAGAIKALIYRAKLALIACLERSEARA
jgi:RNA polymerase sigma-70 factor (ECF subfamily)